MAMPAQIRKPLAKPALPYATDLVQLVASPATAWTKRHPQRQTRMPHQLDALPVDLDVQIPRAAETGLATPVHGFELTDEHMDVEGGVSFDALVEGSTAVEGITAQPEAG